jgi:hypothetical protein
MFPGPFFGAERARKEIHMSEPLSCPICNKQFATKSGLHQHVLHTKEHEDAITVIRRLQAELNEQYTQMSHHADTRFWQGRNSRR